MNDLNKRERDFIYYMLEEAMYQPISYYAKKLNVSTKTLQADLKKIRDFLGDYQIAISACTGKGIKIDGDAGRNIRLLNELNQSSKEAEEETDIRRDNILKTLLMDAEKKTSIVKLSEQYFVSKTSIVNDIKSVEKWLSKYNLSLQKTKDGTYIKGQEKDIRKAIAGYSMREKTRNELLVMFPKEDVEYVEKVIAGILQEQMNMGDIYYINLLTHILICIKRVRENRQLNTDNTTHLINTDTLMEYQNARRIAEQIDEHFHISIGEGEIYYIYQYLISSGFGQEQIQDDQDKEDITAILAQELTRRLSEKYGINFYQEKDLMDGLILHIRPMLNRLEYDIQMNNPLADEIVDRYPEMMGFCSEIMTQLAVKFCLPSVSRDEIANIATYYETMLEKISMHKRILVVCHSGYGTSQLLAAKIRNEFAFMEIVDVVPSRTVEEMELKNIDYIISTVPIQRTDIPHIVVSTLLSEQDIKTIRSQLLKG